MICPKCGANIPDTSKFCTSCGAKMAAPVQPQPQAAQPNTAAVAGGAQPTQTYVQSLIVKKRVSAYLGLGGGIYGMLFALLFLILAIVYFIVGGTTGGAYDYYYYYYAGYTPSGLFIAAAIVMLILCGLNIVSGIICFRHMSSTLAYVRSIQRNPSGIVQYHQTQDRSMAQLMLSIFFGLNAPGIAAGIVALVAKNFVLNNKDKF